MDKATTVRIILFILAWVNTLLVRNGHNPLPVVNEQIVADTITLVISIWTLWKNNSFTKEAKQADAYLKDLKNK